MQGQAKGVCAAKFLCAEPAHYLHAELVQSTEQNKYKFTLLLPYYPTILYYSTSIISVQHPSPLFPLPRLNPYLQQFSFSALILCRLFEVSVLQELIYKSNHF